MSLILALLLQQESPADRILGKAAAARPREEALAFYRHDWAPSLKEAKARAAAERRPVFFVAVTNISGPDDVFSGHC